MAARAGLTREEEIRAAAFRVFREKGYHGTSMQDIADEVGLLKGSLYHYIRSKEELLGRLFEGALESTLEELGQIAAGDGTATARLRQMVTTYALAVVSNLDAVGVYLREYRELPAKELAVVRERRRSMRRLFERVIEQGMRSGEFIRGDAKLATLAILGMCNWMYEWYRPRGRKGAEAVAEELATRAVSSLG
ncbi:MAG: TetR/AcrR family transcriptional regulator [Chloroflexi bacterium]|nr:MAG: TetR/AcrR family transcriptional regulator [Chloroflexota bacterium]